MSLLFVDGFDSYGSNGTNLLTIIGSFGYQTSGLSGGNLETLSDTRSGVGFSMQVPSQQSVTRSFVTQSSIVFGCAVKLENNIGSFISLLYNDLLGSIVDQVVLYANGENGISLTSLDSDLMGASAPNVLFPGVWQWIECKCSPGVSGSCEIKIDGAVVIALTGVKMGYHSAPSLVNQLRFGGGINYGGNFNAECIYDDFYLESQSGGDFNDYLGDVVVHSIFPNADASPNTMTQFGGGVGHFTSVDEQTPDDDASYVFSNTSGQKEVYTLGPLPADIIDVLAVTVNVRAKKDAAGVGLYQALLIDGSTEADGPSVPASVGYQNSAFLVTTPPGGGSWTKTKAQNAKIGVLLP